MSFERDLAQTALQAALDAGATYADVRLADLETQRFGVRNGILEACSSSRSAGVGVRVIVDGAWGFAATSDLDAGLAKVAKRSVEVGRASALLSSGPVRLAPQAAQRGTYATPAEEDPFAAGIPAKVDLLVAASQAMMIDPRITAAEASMNFRRERTIFVSSEGASLDQTILQAGAGISATAAGEDDSQRRSYPASHGGQFATGGFEVVRRMDLAAHAPRVAEEALELLSAPLCPSGITTLILDSSQVALQVHESIGHPTELDRVFGTEAAFAGTSFVSTADRMALRYGSDLVNVVSDGTTPGGLGTVGWDDEGVPPDPTFLIRDGLLAGFQSSRETASRLGDVVSNGTMRADGWSHYPLIRMTNVHLLPGDSSLEQMIGETDDGVLMETNKTWSIDDMRKNFQFGCEAGWEIKAGKRGRLLKNPTYAGMTPAFWGSCDAIAGRDEWVVWGVPNCGKGQPMQVARVGHGASPARFRGVQVGVRGDGG